ncbi:MAG: uroporphyrinogen-III synthase, partial [Acidobacteriota bacterium]
MSRRPRLLLTRDRQGCARWADRLSTLGAEAVALPCLDIVPSSDPRVADALITALADACWLALTSRRGVDAVATILDRLGAPWPTARIAAVGPATAARAREIAGRVDLCPERATAADLARALWQAEGTDVGPVVLATADRGRRDLEAVLRPRGVEVRRIEVYSTRPAKAGRPSPDLDLRSLDGAFLASPSAVRGLLNQIDPPA